MYCFHVIHKTLDFYLTNKIMTPEQSRGFLQAYHDKVKVCAAFSVKVIEGCFGLRSDMVCEPIAGDWATYNTWDNQGELIKTASL